MKDIITRHQADMLILGMAVLGVALLLLCWKIRKSKEGMGYGVLLMLSLPLWLVFNAIEDYHGLDSIKALLINAGLFICVGIMGSRVWVRYVGTSWLGDSLDTPDVRRTTPDDTDCLEDKDAAAI